MTPTKRDLHDRMDDLEPEDEDIPFWMKQVPPSKRGDRTEAWRYLLKQGKQG